ncbi:MAG TPA: LPS export ABC transporter periplasmic protein LptC [Candidatus Elarobacter sp.]|jgi:LPS export ABC transporter protein LptC|nr:LPS export ABC transporter periplasmic protein LptC [Candidatus Elarobacter sp.]
MRFAKPAVLAALLLAAGCARPGAPGGAGTPPPSAAVHPSAAPTATQVPIRVETHGGGGQYVTIVETIRGRKVYTIRALSSVGERFGTNQATGEFDQPHITFLDKNGKTTIADAPKAHVTERNKTVVMTGGVHAHTSSGSTLTCDTLTYIGQTERFHGEGHVVLSAPDGFHLEGQHLDGDTKLENVSVTGGAPR